MDNVGIILSLLFLLIIGWVAGQAHGFKDGQIGALSGKDIRYEIIESSCDGLVWEKIE